MTLKKNKCVAAIALTLALSAQAVEWDDTMPWSMTGDTSRLAVATETPTLASVFESYGLSQASSPLTDLYTNIGLLLLFR